MAKRCVRFSPEIPHLKILRRAAKAARRLASVKNVLGFRCAFQIGTAIQVLHEWDECCEFLKFRIVHRILARGQIAFVCGITNHELDRTHGFEDVLGSIRGNAATLKANQSILDRVAEIQGKAAAKAGVTIQSLTDELEQARGIAIAEKQSSAAVAATMGKAKLHGLGVEHKRVSGSFQLITLTQEQIGKLTPDERTALAAALPGQSLVERLATARPPQQARARPATFDRCQQLGQSAASDADCMRVWAETRDRFLGRAPAPTAPPQNQGQ